MHPGQEHSNAVEKEKPVDLPLKNHQTILQTSTSCEKSKKLTSNSGENLAKFKVSKKLL